MPQDHTERARRAGSGSRGGGPGTLYNLYRSELGRISRCTPEEAFKGASGGGRGRVGAPGGRKA